MLNGPVFTKRLGCALQGVFLCLFVKKKAYIFIFNPYNHWKVKMLCTEKNDFSGSFWSKLSLTENFVRNCNKVDSGERRGKSWFEIYQIVGFFEEICYTFIEMKYQKKRLEFMRRYRGKRHQRRKGVLAAIAFLLIVSVVGASVYVRDFYPADTAALAAMESDGEVQVSTEGNTTVFLPESGAECGFVFYPGGKVEHTAYAPLLRGLAEQGILCVLTEMPFHLAVLDVNAADGIPEQYPEITDWYIGGHSLGGSMAAAYAADHTDPYDGLVLLASYSTEDLSNTELRVISVYGSKDGVLDFEKYRENAGNLPASTIEAVVDGGNHACFGSYGAQDGDGTPEITADWQVKTTVSLLAEFFAQTD